MNTILFTTFVLVCILTHVIRTIYEILKHKKVITANKLTFSLIFPNMLLLWVSWFGLCSLDPSVFNFPNIIRYLGIAFIIVGIILFLTALFTINTLETYDGNLITNGVYSIIRHPMYLGFILWLVGTPIYYGGIYSVLLAIPFITNVLFWRYLEELELEKRFIDYKVYKVKTYF